MRTKEEKEESYFFSLLCDLERALEDEHNAQEMDSLSNEFIDLLDEWDVVD